MMNGAISKTPHNVLWEYYYYALLSSIWSQVQYSHGVKAAFMFMAVVGDRRKCLK